MKVVVMKNTELLIFLLLRCYIMSMFVCQLIKDMEATYRCIRVVMNDNAMIITREIYNYAVRNVIRGKMKKKGNIRALLSTCGRRCGNFLRKQTWNWWIIALITAYILKVLISLLCIPQYRVKYTTEMQVGMRLPKLMLGK